MQVLESAIQLTVYLVLGCFLLLGGILVSAFVILALVTAAVDRFCTIMLDLFTGAEER